MWKRISVAIAWRAKLLITGKDAVYFKKRPSSAVAAEIWKSQTNDRLLDLISAVIPVARKVSHADIAAKMHGPPYTPEIWPGEKYKLLSALVTVLKPSVVIEIGTASGLSALSLKKYLPPGGKLYTFDIRPWKTVPNTVLKESDFADGRMVQINEDLCDKEVFAKHSEMLRKASLVFMDVGVDEQRREERIFLANFETLDFETDPVFVLNDIRIEKMLDVWEDLTKPKQDVTSFGHWSGNGLVDWNG